MKKNIVLLLILSGNFSFSQSIKSIAHPDIKEVKVFLTGAQVKREIKTTIEPGITQLMVEGLSASIDKKSITVNGTGDIVLLSVVHQLNYIDGDKKTPEINRLEESLESLKLDLDKANSLDEVYTEEVSLLKANKAVGGANGGVDPDNLKEVADFFRTRMIELKVKLIDIHREQKNLNEKIAKVNQQLAELNANRNQPTSTIMINVSAKQQGPVNLQLGYMVSGAGWSPAYDVRVKDISSPVQLAYKANVFQNSGENWEEVKLILSTGNPAQGGNKPILNPWYIDFYTPTVNGTEIMIRGSRSDATSYDVDGIKVQKQLQTIEYNTPLIDAPSINVAENQLSTDFEIQLPYSIPSDGKKYTVDIKNHELKATYNYYAAPKLDKDAFLLAKVTGWAEYNLLPGLANIYFEGGYIGESVLNPRTTGDTLDLSLGRDKKIIITREMKKDLSTTKFVGGNIVKELNYEISVRNTKREAIHIILDDQVPITKNSDIKVSMEEYSAGEYDKESGKVTWNLDVPPSTTQTRKLGFTVKYPKERVVNGL